MAEVTRTRSGFLLAGLLILILGLGFLLSPPPLIPSLSDMAERAAVVLLTLVGGSFFVFVGFRPAADLLPPQRRT